MNWTDEDEKTLMELQFRRQEISSAQDTVWKKYGMQPRADLMTAAGIACLRADLAQFDPAEEIRIAAVAKLTKLGYRWADGAWVCLAAPAGTLPPFEPAWNDWGGGGCPVPLGTWVEVRHRNGEQYRGPAGRHYAESWTHLGAGSDIIAYRICSPR